MKRSKSDSAPAQTYSDDEHDDDEGELTAEDYADMRRILTEFAESPRSPEQLAVQEQQVVDALATAEPVCMCFGCTHLTHCTRHFVDGGWELSEHCACLACSYKR